MRSRRSSRFCVDTLSHRANRRLGRGVGGRIFDEEHIASTVDFVSRFLPFGPSSGKRGEGEVACSGNQLRNLVFDQSQESGVASPRNHFRYNFLTVPDIAPKEATLWCSFRVEMIEEKIAARYFNDEISSRSSNLFGRAISPEQAIAPPKGP